MSNSLKAQGKAAFFWDFIGKLATQGTSFIVLIFLARILEPSDFGIVAIIMIIFGIATVFSDIGLSGALIQRKRVTSIHYTSVFYFNISVALLLTLITFFSAKSIANFYQIDKLIPLIEVTSISFILNAINTVHITKFKRELNYKILTKISYIASLISGIIGIYFAYMGAGVWSLIAQLLTLNIVTSILIWKNSTWRPRYMFSLKALLQLWAFGFRMFLVNLLDVIYKKMDYIIIAKLFPIATLGFFERAKSLNVMAIQYSSGSLMAVLFPILSKVQSDLARFQKIIIKTFGIISFIVFIIFCNMYLVSEELIVILFSDKWLPSANYLSLLVLSGFAYPLNALLVNVLSSRGNSKAFLRMAIYKKTVAFLNLAIAFQFGIEGFLYGLILVSFINTAITIFMAARESQIAISTFYQLIIPQMIIAIISVILTLQIVNLMVLPLVVFLITKIVIFSTTYIALNWLFKTKSFEYFMEELIEHKENRQKRIK
jgi:O-antigen/teichoic acid export membrane protein